MTTKSMEIAEAAFRQGEWLLDLLVASQQANNSEQTKRLLCGATEPELESALLHAVRKYAL